MTGTWAATLASKTWLHYASLYDHHLRPYLASIALRDISPETIGRWQADRLVAGAGPVAVRHAMDLFGSVLEHAFVSGRIAENPVRRVKKASLPRRDEAQALSPMTIEAMRSALSMRDATLLSVLGYAGLRPGEALGLRWGDIRERTILIQRSVSLGEEADTKTRQHRTVRLVAPRCGSAQWRLAAGGPDDTELVFPWKDGHGHWLRISPGAGEPSDAAPRSRSGACPSVRPPAQFSPRCCCTKEEASSTSPVSSVMTPG